MSASPRLGPYEYTPTFKVASTDAVQYLSTDYTLRAPSGGGNQSAQYAMIQVRDADILWNISPPADPDITVPAQTDVGAESICGEDGIIFLNGESAIAGFCFISAVAVTPARLIVTLGF